LVAEYGDAKGETPGSPAGFIQARLSGIMDTLPLHSTAAA
jgi:hypothetical protein